MKNKSNEISFREQVLTALDDKNSIYWKKFNLVRKTLFGLKNSFNFEEAKKIGKELNKTLISLHKENYKKYLGTSKINFNNLEIHCNSDAAHEVTCYFSEFDDEFRIFNLYKEITIPEMNCIDVGMNIGVHSLVMSDLFYKGTVFSFEPVQEHIEKAKKNFELNEKNNIKIHKEVLFSKEKKVAFNQNLDNYNKGVGRIDEKNKKIKNVVLTKTLDSFEFDKIHLMKIDVEGFEIEVLKGSQETLKKFKPHIILEKNPNWGIKDLTDNIPYDCKIFIIPNTVNEQYIELNKNVSIKSNRLNNLYIKPIEK